MNSEILQTADTKMQKTIEALKKGLLSIRTGRATSALVDNIGIDYYGTITPLNQISSVSTPEARLIVIQPWDRSALSNIEKAILKSDLGINPTNDGNVIRLILPPLNEERRKELVKVARKEVEECKISLRHVRREAVEELKKLEKDKQISQDEEHRAVEQLQKITDSSMSESDKVGQDKEAEILEI